MATKNEQALLREAKKVEKARKVMAFELSVFAGRNKVKAHPGKGKHYYRMPDGSLPPWRIERNDGYPLNIKETKRAKMCYLKALAYFGIKSQAARAVGLPPSVVTEWEKKEKFSAKVEEAMMEHLDFLEVIAVSRAIEKSDSLLMSILRAKRPQVYGSRLKMDHLINSVEPVRLIFSQAEVGEADVVENAPQD